MLSRKGDLPYRRPVPVGTVPRTWVRSRGVRAIASGPPGAAEAVARFTTAAVCEIRLPVTVAT